MVGIGLFHWGSLLTYSEPFESVGEQMKRRCPGWDPSEWGLSQCPSLMTYRGNCPWLADNRRPQGLGRITY